MFRTQPSHPRLLRNESPTRALAKGMQNSEIEIIEARAADAAELIKIMANPARLKLICALYKGEKTVSALKNLMGLSQSAMSQHLACLRKHNLVMVRYYGSRRYYSLVEHPVHDILHALKVICH